ncbi:EAL domain-containing protein [Salinispirillum marinum]|uniref:EAL domain-containing protein n=2 Tax=Saccharospirillaceae TaxID=255527 RepID=A0ABV8BDS8_9GAMM
MSLGTVWYQRIVLSIIGCLSLMALFIYFLLPPLTQSISTGSSITHVRVGLYENEPKIYTNSAGKPDGLFIDLLQSMAREEGWILHFEDCEWNRCLSLLAEGQLDLMPDVAFSVDRATQFSFHDHPVTQAWSQVFVRPDTPMYQFPDLASARLVLLEGSIQQSFLRTELGELWNVEHIVLVQDLEDGFRRVASGEADAVVASNFYGNRKRGLYGLAGTPLTFNQVGLYFAAPLNAPMTPVLLGAIDRHLLRWQDNAQSPLYHALAEASTAPVERRVPMWLLILTAVLAGLVVLGLAAAQSLRWTVTRRTAELANANRRFAHLLTSSPAVLFTWNSDARAPSWVSDNVKAHLGFDPLDVTQEGFWEQHVHSEDRSMMQADIKRVELQGHVQMEYRIRDQQGVVRYLRDDRRWVMGESGEPQVVGTWTDITEQHRQDEKLHYITRYDDVTGLPNRQSFMDRLQHAVEMARQDERSITLILIDLDRFKHINEAWGVGAGDQVLRVLGERLRFATMPDILARLSADEFALLIERPLSTEQQKDHVLHLFEQLEIPIWLQGNAMVVTASFGVSGYPRDALQADQLMKSAELAMHEAKKSGGNSWAFYQPDFANTTEHMFKLENALRQALQNHEFFIHFQPQFDLTHHELVGVEALIRWEHPELGMVSPAIFIPLAEEIGLVEDLDAWVLEEACAQLRLWDIAGFHVPRVSVNISAHELDKLDLVERIKQALVQFRLAPQRLQVEVTESVLMRAPERCISVLNLIRNQGVSVAIDDFGTGYSNLVYLRGLPLDCLKIDQSFVREIGASPAADTLIHAIIAMAKALDLNIVAEGIETQRELTFLAEAGCHYGQGFHMGRPMAPTDLKACYPSAIGAHKGTFANSFSDS